MTFYIPGVKLMDAKSAKAEERASQVLELIRERYERYVRLQYIRILRDIYRAVLDLDRIPDIMEVYEIVNASHEAQKRTLTRMVTVIYPEASLLVIPDDQIGKSIDGRIEHKAREDTERELIQQWLNDNVGTFIRDLDAVDITSDMWYIDETTVRDIRKAIIDSNGNLDQFRESVRVIMGTTPNRAYTIARTETARATNVSMHIAAETYSFDRPMVKVWKTYGGYSVRPDHAVMEGMMVGKDEMFMVPNRMGGFDMMQYPLDGAHGASAGNIVNCRCHCAYRYAD